MPHVKITQAVVDGLPFNDATTWFHDTELAGFNMSVGRKSKTYYAAAETRTAPSSKVSSRVITTGHW